MAKEKSDGSTPSLQIVLALIAVSGVIGAALIANLGKESNNKVVEPQSPVQVTNNNSNVVNLPVSPPAAPATTQNQSSIPPILYCLDDPAVSQVKDITSSMLQLALEQRVMYGYVECVKILIDSGADINGSVLQVPILYEAIHQRKWPMVKLLLEKGADPNLHFYSKTEKRHVLPLFEARIAQAPDDVVNSIKGKGGRDCKTAAGEWTSDCFQ
jgi:hypothetical protein